MITPVILLTRPADASNDMRDRLAPRFVGRVRWVISPLIAIVPSAALPDLQRVAALIFTSQNGVEAYIAAKGRVDLPCYTVGDTTARAARDAGMTAISAGGDADALVARILADGQSGPYIHLRGEHARGDIAERLRAADYDATDAVIYAQQEQPLSKQAQDALQGHVPVIIPLFSPRSAALLGEGPFAAPLYVVALSKTVAKELRCRVEECHVAPHPDRSSMTQKLVDLLNRAPWNEGNVPQD